MPYCWGCLERRFCPGRIIRKQNISIKKYLVTKKVLACRDIPYSHGNIIRKDNSFDSNEAQELMSANETAKDHVANNNDDSIQPCAICLETFKAGQNVSWSKHLIFCKHVYHTECIAAWLRGGNDICPCCRRDYYSIESTTLCFGSDKYSDEGDRIKAVLSAGEFCESHGLCLPPHAQFTKEVSAESMTKTAETARESVRDDVETGSRLDSTR